MTIASVPDKKGLQLGISERAAGVVVDEIVFNGAQRGEEVVVFDSVGFHALGVRLSGLPQQIGPQFGVGQQPSSREG
jgi:hypothetical protein